MMMTRRMMPVSPRAVLIMPLIVVVRSVWLSPVFLPVSRNVPAALSTALLAPNVGDGNSKRAATAHANRRVIRDVILEIRENIRKEEIRDGICGEDDDHADNGRDEHLPRLRDLLLV